VPRALVTGANGFVGSHLVDLLLERGWEVRGLVRATGNLAWLPRDRMELVNGEVTEPRTLPPALAGVDTVFHVAGAVRAPDPTLYRRVNVEGTRHLVEAARHANGISRFLLVSSLAAGGSSRPGSPRREEDPAAPTGPYGRSKLEGEEVLRREAGRLPYTIVRPPAVYGPRDRAFLILAGFARRGWSFRLSGPHQPASIVHARDLAEGILAAALSPAAVGRTYYLAHPEPTSGPEVIGIMARWFGRPVRSLTVPRSLVPWVASLTGMITGLVGRENPLPPNLLRDLLAPAWTCDTSLARRDLGFVAGTPLEAGLAETMEWYGKAGWV
jgi:nucleoside-diphosphate-sugar epimerase